MLYESKSGKQILNEGNIIKSKRKNEHARIALQTIFTHSFLFICFSISSNNAKIQVFWKV